MTPMTTDRPRGLGSAARVALWGTVAALLAVPLFVSQFSWTGSDFALAAVLLTIPAVLVELAARSARGWSYVVATAIATLIGLVTIWIDLAVGIVSDGGNLASVLFIGTPLGALAGALVVRGEPRRMVGIALAAAVGCAGLSLAYYGAEPVLLKFGTILTVGWLASAGLYHRARRSV